MLEQGTWRPRSCWLAAWVSCGLQSQPAFHSNQQLLLESIQDRLPSGKYLGVSYVEIRAFQAGVFNVQSLKKNKFCCLCLGTRSCGRTSRAEVSGAATAAVQQQLLCSGMFPKILSTEIALILRGQGRELCHNSSWH